MSATLSAVVSSTRGRRAQPALYIGLCGDDPTALPARFSLSGLDRVEIRRADARRSKFERAGGTDVLEIDLTDARLSRHHARLTRDGASWVFEDLRSKNGSLLDGRKIARRQLVDGDVIIVGHTALVYRSTGGDAKPVTGVMPEVAPGLRTMSPALHVQFERLALAAATNVAIEITGETGAGKELIARAVHAASKRPGAFVAVNCGGLVISLREGELFGHRKGAFTGATTDRPGLIRSAHGGTLFLDEIAELPGESQATLLRVLQDCEVTPLGADRPVRVDFRVVSATHQNLDEAVAAGRFRADLRARLLGCTIALPPLRERPEDLGLVVTDLLARLTAPCRSDPIGFSVDALAALYTYDWPLNIRELERALATAIALARERIELSHLPAAVASSLGDQSVIDEAALPAEERALRTQLAVAISRHGGNIAAVARELDKDRTQIRRWMRRFGLRRDSDA